jgi:hypothetical protein
MFNQYFKQYWKDVNFAGEVNMTFFFKELTFLLLPLFILYPISAYFGQVDFLYFCASTDFSFVIVVLMAMNLTGFIELKAKTQRSIGFKLFEGLKIYLLFLIGSSITLSLNLMNEFKVLTIPIKESIFVTMNAFLFFIGVYSLFLKTLYEIGQSHSLGLIREFKTRNQIIKIIDIDAIECNKKLTHLLYTIENFEITSQLNSEEQYDFKNFQRKTSQKIDNIKNLINDNEKLINEIKVKLENRKDELEKITVHNSTLPKAGHSWWQKLFGSE